MTNKQIIIDNVDVNGCEFYNKVIGEDAYCNIDEEHLCTCISYDNCYYKQLKRKEQECEELKDLNTRLDNQRETYWKGYQKLEQTLIEIKEIAENGKRFAERYMVTGEQKANVLTYANAILQKISEVIPNEN